MATKSKSKSLPLGEALNQRYDALQADMGVLLSTLEDLATYIIPRRLTRILRTFDPEGRKLHDRVFDSTAPKSNVNLASFIASTLTNQTIRWFSLIVDNETLSRDQEVRQWLDSVASKMFQAFNASNFNVEIQETYQDLGAFGTASLILEEKAKDEGENFGGFLFRTEAAGTYAISEGPDGRVDTVFRLLKMPATQVAQKFGEENLSRDLKSILKMKPMEKVDILHAVFPRDLPQSVSFNSIKTKMPVASVYVERKTKNIVHQGGFREMPWFVVRWSKGSSEIWGRGPGHTAYPDIRSLNKAMELTFRAWGKVIDPPINVLDDAVIGRVSSIPAALNIVTDPQAIQPWQHGGNFEVNNVLLSDLRNSIKQAFFADQLQLPDKTIITATEVERRLELMQQVLGPVVGRLEYELLSPMIDRAFNMLLRAEELPPMPAALANFVKQNQFVKIRVQYEGTLARAQRAANLAAIQKFLNLAVPIAQIKPESLDRVDFDEMVTVIGRDTNIPATIMKTMAAVRRERRQRQAQLQQQQQVEQVGDASVIAQNFGNAAKAFDESNTTSDELESMGEVLAAR